MLSLNDIDRNKAIDYIIHRALIADLARIIDMAIDHLPVLIEVTWILIIVFGRDLDWSTLGCRLEILQGYQKLLQISCEILAEQVDSLDDLGNGQFHWLQ